MGYCIAFSKDHVADVTGRYVRRTADAALRTRCTEAELLHIIQEIRSLRAERLTDEEKQVLHNRRLREQKELQDMCIATLVSDFRDHWVAHLGNHSHRVDPETGKVPEGIRASGDIGK